MKVFLSSTALDLQEYRQVADDTILRLSQDAVAMERFGPLPGEPVAECERKAAESDVVVCIVAHRYGFVPEQGKGSITRREVEAARAAGKDVLAWVVDDAHPWTGAKEQDLLTDPSVIGDSARVADVLAGVQALIEFKAWLRASFTCESFTTPDDLGRKIAIALKNRAVPGPAPSRRAEVRIIHALQPAPHFAGRETLVDELAEWVGDLASPDRVWSLVAAGGTGKTALIERVLRDHEPPDGSVLVWSFYERPDADAFLRECNQLFLGEEDGAAAGRLERLQRGLRDGRPHLIVLDGLERVQEDAGAGRVRGELSDQTLKLLLRSLAAGLGRARGLVTSRYPLVDLQDWEKAGYRHTPLDDLSPEAAVAVLHGWDVTGDDADLRAAAAQVGHHALSIAVIGSYLQSFADGRIDAVRAFELDAVTGDDPKAAKLSRVLAFYAERLPNDERDLLARLSVFPRGVALDLLAVLVDAGGEVAGLLVDAGPRLVSLLRSLRSRGLVFEYRSDETVTWSAHPFLRERFRTLLDCPVEDVFDVVAAALGAGLERIPETKPTDLTEIDRYERLIEATRLAGREKEAFDLYFEVLGGYGHLGSNLGEFALGYRILAAFSRSGNPRDLAPTLDLRFRSVVANDLALFAEHLGRLSEASRFRQFDDECAATLNDPQGAVTGHMNASDLAFALGFLPEALMRADKGVAEASPSKDLNPNLGLLVRGSLAYAGAAAHALGDIAAARENFAKTIELEGGPLVSLRAAQEGRHLVDLDRFAEARASVARGIEVADRHDWNDEHPWFHCLLARVELAEGGDPTLHLETIRAWTSRTGDMASIIEAHLLAAQYQLAQGDTQAALAEAEDGLVHAEACGYGLLRIELLIVLARVHLVWPDRSQAIKTAREALDLAAHPDCRYAWGEADAAQVWGEAYFANREFALARRAFERCLEVRERIEHPGQQETHEWLARLADAP